MDLWKYHGAGNDFLLLDVRRGPLPDLSALAAAVCHRRFGIGADGLMAVDRSVVADIKMHYYNSDGSPAAMCGNGIRCFARFVRDRGIRTADRFTVETGAGVRSVAFPTGADSDFRAGVGVDADASDGPGSDVIRSGVGDGPGADVTRSGVGDGPGSVASPVPVVLVEVDMGPVPAAHSLDLAGRRFLSMEFGVPHAVHFLTEEEVRETCGSSGYEDEGRILACLEAMADALGPAIEKDPAFPAGTNVNFVWPAGSNRLLLCTWERGAGRTLACGTGACAAAIAYRNGAAPIDDGAMENGEAMSNVGESTPREGQVAVRMPGGEVTIRFDVGQVYMTGPAAYVAAVFWPE